MKRLIKWLYRRYCRKEYLFELGEPIDYGLLPKEMQIRFKLACKGYSNDGVLKHLASIRVSGYEADILYSNSNKPVTTTEAELTRLKINGIHEFFQDVESIAEQADERFDEFDTI
jgi:hypothetical protein